jgi:tetratricopeptide (TPR) repeat protein
VLGALGDLPGAEREERRVLARLPFDVDAGNTLAGILLKRGDVDGAIAMYQRMLDSPWSNRRHRAETCFSLGVAEEKRARPDRAETAAEWYGRALREEPRHVKAMGNLALLRLRQGKNAEAEVLLRKVVEVDPGLAIGRVNLAVALAGQGRGAEALRELEVAAKLAPGEAGVRSAIGDLQAQMGRAADAVASYEAAVKLAPGSVEAQTKLGMAYLRAERFDDAAAAFTSALSIKPDHEPAKAGLSAAAARRSQGK